MMLLQVALADTLSAFVESSRAPDLENRMSMLLARLVVEGGVDNQITVSGWDFGGAGSGPEFMVVLEYSNGQAGIGSVLPGLLRFFFYSASDTQQIINHRAAAMARATAWAAQFPTYEPLMLDTQISGGSKGLAQMGMIVIGLSPVG
jgi:hypothetical protein